MLRVLLNAAHSSHPLPERKRSPTMETVIKKLYYAVRWPLGQLLLLLRNFFFIVTYTIGIRMAIGSIQVAMWLNNLGAEILPEMNEEE